MNWIGNLGILGLLGMTLFFPGVLFFVGRKRTSLKRLENISKLPASTVEADAFPLITVVIPAHNEEKVIVQTIRSIEKSVQIASQMVNIEPSYFLKGIIVGADRCSDLTANLARENKAQVLEGNFGSKWKNLGALLNEVNTPWVALVDAGSIWFEDFFHYLIPSFKNKNLVGIAPAYEEHSGDDKSELAKAIWKLKNLNWWIERFFKLFENTSGGPMSIHGATVVYKTKELKEVFRYLESEFSETNWMNDDVVIPLLLRTFYPDKDIRYFVGDGVQTLISDVGSTSSESIEKNRRIRLVNGNLQWIRLLLPLVLKLNWGVGVLALRRVFRVLWAYWIVLIAIQIFFELSGVIAAIFLTFKLVFVFSFRRAFLASLFTPYFLFLESKKKPVRWR